MSFQTATLKYFAIAKVSYSHATAYYFDAASIGLMVGIRLWVLTQLYTVTYRVNDATSIGGLTLATAIWSLMFTNCFLLCSGTRGVLLSISEDIKSGNIAYILGRPYSFLLYLFSNFSGRFVARFLPTIVVSSLVTLLLVGPISFTLAGLLAGVLLALIGLSMNAVIIFCLGLLAFWTEEVKPYRWIWEKAQWTLGGIMIPLSLFPDSLRQVAEYLPFGAVYYPSARMFVGFDAHMFWKFLGVQIFWLVIALIIMIRLYKKGSKEVSINGG